MARTTWLVGAALLAVAAAGWQWRTAERMPPHSVNMTGGANPSPASTAAASSAAPSSANARSDPIAATVRASVPGDGSTASEGSPARSLSAPSASPVVPAAASGARVTLVAPTTAKAGGVVEVRVDIDAPSQARAMVVAVRYDPGLLQLVEANEGELISRPGGERSLDVTTASGQLDLTARVLHGPAIEGTGTLAQITFNAVRTGEIALGATIVASSRAQ